LEIAFESLELREICEKDSEARRVLGDELAELMQRRIADLRAARFLSELPFPVQLRDEGSGAMVLNLADVGRMTLVSNHIRTPTTSDGAVDLARITRVRILEIEDSRA